MKALLFGIGVLAPVMALCFASATKLEPEVGENPNRFQRTPAAPRGFRDVVNAKHKNLPEAQQAILDTLGINRKAETADKKAAGKGGVHELESQVRDTLNGIQEGNKLYLYNVKDPITGKAIVDKCEVGNIHFLGAGGTAVVVQISIESETARYHLGSDTFAMKLLYSKLPSGEPSPNWINFVLGDMADMIDGEIAPLRESANASRKAGRHNTAKSIAKDNGWALPAFEATVGTAELTFFLKGGVGFFNRAILAEPMLGDGAQLLFESASGRNVSRLPVKAREYFCQQLITTTAKLHAANLVHQDIKPENVLIGKDGLVNLADFGMLGKVGDRRRCAERITYLFMDPTHARCTLRDSFSFLTEKYDAWSVGMTCYIIMTNGDLPYHIFIGDGAAEHLASLDKTISYRSRTMESPAKKLKAVGISDGWADTVTSLLDRDRNHRPTLRQVLSTLPE
ncbi:uncharacterized protein LOC34618072 [Cyclospora cayetanensis]|uniref:Uncharacterized protein LOC34618072 n=1 Tax=Cyclospora cayetanensis TaxID=88456 RepID=A0A6P6S1H7_9EIME|nr:uncharacterized protein LOC34618072 [Cyclospora cayetanensis]